MSSPPYDIFPSSLKEGSDIVFSDPSDPFVVKPFIQDLLRTRYCVLGSVFLVEGIDRVAPIRRRYRAVRLLVSDGISCVQAVLKGEAHGLVDNGLIYPGCYVRVDSFELRFLNLHDSAKVVRADESNEAATSAKKSDEGPQKMAYLVLENPVTVGWNTAYLKILESHGQVSVPSAVPGKAVLEAEHARSMDAEEAKVTVAPAAMDREELRTATDALESSPDYGSPPEPALQSLDMPTSDVPRPQPKVAGPPVGSSSNAAQPPSEHLPWSTDDPTKPVKLTPLRMIPNLPYKQNWMVNVLAVVASISEVEPSHLPPYHQRTARLADPSTSKQVLLTVFLDPDDFNPSVGSVVLILGVKNHRFDGGSLKKYASDRPKNGAPWWLEEPMELGWCDVTALRRWWDSKQSLK